jgi:hypothetical protein
LDRLFPSNCVVTWSRFIASIGNSLSEVHKIDWPIPHSEITSKTRTCMDSDFRHSLKFLKSQALLQTHQRRSGQILHSKIVVLSFLFMSSINFLSSRNPPVCSLIPGSDVSAQTGTGIAYGYHPVISFKFASSRKHHVSHQVGSDKMFPSNLLISSSRLVSSISLCPKMGADPDHHGLVERPRKAGPRLRQDAERTARSGWTIHD